MKAFLMASYRRFLNYTKLRHERAVSPLAPLDQVPWLEEEALRLAVRSLVPAQTERRGVRQESSTGPAP